ncbi:hypothetical protein M422DRAFT_22869 [Sphaerobolus stellatus SS14]|nr:hypothetical protein M422DRAFT_22869 [Sphaerobolus stellatus SS14]
MLSRVGSLKSSSFFIQILLFAVVDSATSSQCVLQAFEPLSVSRCYILKSSNSDRLLFIAVFLRIFTGLSLSLSLSLSPQDLSDDSYGFKLPLTAS